MSTRKFSPVVSAAQLVLCFSLVLPTHLHAGGRQRAVAVSPPSSDLSLTFLEGGQATTAVVDAGTISWRGGRKQYSVTVAIRIGKATREARGTATLRAYLETPDPHAAIRVDGILLGATPRVIQRNAPIGIAMNHRLEIEVPVSAPEGTLAATIGWEVTTE
jgi:hypothetical protein